MCTSSNGNGTDLDPFHEVTVWQCGECGEASVDHHWTIAWHAERRRRVAAPEYTVDDYGESLGLDDRMVCPRCTYVHSDDESSWIGEHLWTAIPKPASPSVADVGCHKPNVITDPVGYARLRDPRKADAMRARRNRIADAPGRRGINSIMDPVAFDAPGDDRPPTTPVAEERRG